MTEIYILSLLLMFFAGLSLLSKDRLYIPAGLLVLSLTGLNISTWCPGFCENHAGIIDLILHLLLLAFIIFIQIKIPTKNTRKYKPRRRNRFFESDSSDNRKGGK